jgi:hypothetical protein
MKRSKTRRKRRVAMKSKGHAHLTHFGAKLNGMR